MVLVIGTGAAGYNAAKRLREFGVQNLTIVTDNVFFGTSRNTGSDKQTYYKMSSSGSNPDSVQEMANELFSGGAVDGEHALIEASLSSRCFYHLVELGVPFPENEYGEFVGYRTDHSEVERASSVGPYTSREMTHTLEMAVKDLGIPILDHHRVVKLNTEKNKVVSIEALNTDTTMIETIPCQAIIIATGGPAEIYADSVYPVSQTGMTGAAIAAGAKCRNLTEWQFGMASVKPRWNVSGTYMQALPRFISTEKDGSDEREFLNDHLPDLNDLLEKTFLKGYQWPFDADKALNGSSLIDILVFHETTQKKRRVFLDFRTNPNGSAIDFSKLSKETTDYLKSNKALLDTPFERLMQMNRPAVEFYREHGVDLETQMLEIAVCAQHCNGGISVDRWWRTTIDGIYACGEAACTHGVKRPGGSALNAGQVGSLRAAWHCAKTIGNVPEPDKGIEVNEPEFQKNANAKPRPRALIDHFRESMSACGGLVREPDSIRKRLEDVSRTLKNLPDELGIRTDLDIRDAYILRDILHTQSAVLGSMLDFCNHVGRSRGSALYSDSDGKKSLEALPEMFRFKTDDHEHDGVTQEIQNGKTSWRAVNPIPRPDRVFESAWRTFRDTGNI